MQAISLHAAQIRNTLDNVLGDSKVLARLFKHHQVRLAVVGPEVSLILLE